MHAWKNNKLPKHEAQGLKSKVFSVKYTKYATMKIKLRKKIFLFMKTLKNLAIVLQHAKLIGE